MTDKTKTDKTKYDICSPGISIYRRCCEYEHCEDCPEWDRCSMNATDDEDE